MHKQKIVICGTNLCRHLIDFPILLRLVDKWRKCWMWVVNCMFKTIPWFDSHIGHLVNILSNADSPLQKLFKHPFLIKKQSLRENIRELFLWTELIYKPLVTDRRRNIQCLRVLELQIIARGGTCTDWFAIWKIQNGPNMTSTSWLFQKLIF